MSNFLLEPLAQDLDFGWDLDNMLSQIQESDWIFVEPYGSISYMCQFHNVFPNQAEQYVNYLHELQQVYKAKANKTDPETIFADATILDESLILVKTQTDIAGQANFNLVNKYHCIFNLRNADKWKAQVAYDFPIDPKALVETHIPDNDFYSYPITEISLTDKTVYIHNLVNATKGAPVNPSATPIDQYYRLIIKLVY